jgi:ParB family transcriptional regulator, chromosome partitioning protein
MEIDASHAKLKEIPVDHIDRNPENPRLRLRQSELLELLESIRLYGVQVPIAVYKQGNRYVLIDGERRWRCCKKLNKKTIPALVQRRPSPLENLLLMFNIHALREQWDLLTIALKLPRIIELLTHQSGRLPTDRELCDRTGLGLGILRRCKLLMELPEEYKRELLLELEKPKAARKVTEDVFIEMERALRTVERAMPTLIGKKNKNVVRRVLLDKYKRSVIKNVVHFRKLGKIARAAYVKADEGRAKGALQKVFQENSFGIEEAYGDSVSDAYSERDLLTRVSSLVERLKEYETGQIDKPLIKPLRQLLAEIRRLLEEE